MPKKKGYGKLMKKGAPHPTRKGFKLESAHIKEEDAEKASNKLELKPRVVGVRIMSIPKQYLVWGKRAPRITPKTPRLRR